MRTGLAADADAALLAATDQLDAAGRRDVQDVDARPGQLGQGDLAVDHHLFRRRRQAAQAQTHALEAFVHDAAARQVEVLGVAQHRLVEHRAVFHRPAHDLGADDRRTVVGEGDGAALDQTADLRQFRAACGPLVMAPMGKTLALPARCAWR